MCQNFIFRSRYYRNIVENVWGQKQKNEINFVECQEKILGKSLLC